MKKIISIFLTLITVVTLTASSSAITQAVTYVNYGDWLLAVNSDTSYLVGGYSGNETELVMPKTANGKAIVGVAEDFADKCGCDLVSVTMPDSYTTIESCAFYNCPELTSVDFSSGLSNIGWMAFADCAALDRLDLSDADGLKSIPYACFSGCTALSSIQLPDNLLTISDYAFSRTAIESIDLPDSLTDIGGYSFSFCAALEAVELPYSVRTIGEGGFRDCNSLSDATLGNALESIGAYAFYNDTLLTSVYVPLSVSYIGAYAFHPMAIEGGTLTLDCYEDTYTASYAYSNYLNCTLNKFLKGDINNDGKVNIRDVTCIQLYRVGLYDIDDDAKTIDKGDVTGDYRINIRDATRIQLYIAQIIDEL